MYCTKCGKFIEGESTLCPECQKAEQEAQMQAWQAQAAQPQQGSVMAGFGKALTATILSVMGVVFVIIALAFTGVAADYGYESMISAAVVFILLTIACIVISLIFGISSIKLFTNAKSSGAKKPIPAVVMGISAIGMSAFSALYLFIIFMALGLLMI